MAKDAKMSVDQIPNGAKVAIIGGTWNGYEGTFLRLTKSMAWVALAVDGGCWETIVKQEHIEYRGPKGPCPV